VWGNVGRTHLAVHAASMLALVSLSMLANSARAAEVRIERCRARGDSVEIVARLEVRASPEQLWRVLTDYDSMARFVPGMDRSKRIARSLEGPIVEQVSVARVLFVRSRVLTVLQMKERAPDTLSFRAIAGDFRRLRGIWVLERLANGGTRARCWCAAVPRRWVPGTLLAWAARGEFEPRARAIGREAERRAHASAARHPDTVSWSSDVPSERLVSNHSPLERLATLLRGLGLHGLLAGALPSALSPQAMLV